MRWLVGPSLATWGRLSTAGPRCLRRMWKASAAMMALMAMPPTIGLGSTVARAVLPPLLGPEWLLLLVEDWVDWVTIVTGAPDVAGLAAAAWRISLISCSALTLPHAVNSLPHFTAFCKGEGLKYLKECAEAHLWVSAGLAA